MKLIYTDRALASLQECLDFLAPEIPSEKVNEIRDQILNRADRLLENPFIGQEEPHLAHLELSHRRIIEGNYKVIYRVEKDVIYVTDIFDSRQDPERMQGRIK